METIRQVVLVVQLFFNDGQMPGQVRQHINFENVDECYAGVKRVIADVKDFHGRKIVSIAAGCYVEYGEPA